MSQDYTPADKGVANEIAHVKSDADYMVDDIDTLDGGVEVKAGGLKRESEERDHDGANDVR